MKKCFVIFALVFLLSGCTAVETWETVSDVQDAPVMSQTKNLQLTLPKDAVVATMENEQGGTLYLCDGYTVTVQKLEAGDVNETLKSISGFQRQQLSVMETKQSGIRRYDCVWTSAGEGEEQIARAAVLDDGSYHYAVTLMTPAGNAGAQAESWQKILSSLSLGTDE